MQFFAKRHINTECISLGITLDWNVNLGIEIEFLFWTLDLTIIENFKKYQHKINSLFHRKMYKGE